MSTESSCRPVYCVGGPCAPSCLRMDDPEPIQMPPDRLARTAARIRAARDGLADDRMPDIPIRRAAELYEGHSAPTARELGLYAEACRVSVDWLLTGATGPNREGAPAGSPQPCPGHADCPRCDVTDPCPCCGLRYVNGAWTAPDLASGFWPNMTGGMCARCHLAVNRGEEIDPEHQVCAAINDGMRITTAPARPDEVMLHLPAFTYWDTQAYSAEVGIPAEHLPALKAVVDAWLAQQAVDAGKEVTP